MPPRYAYWTIIFENQPTAFRAASRDDLLPTFKQIQAKHPDAVIKFFARGKLWDSEEAARAALFARRDTRRPKSDVRGPKPDFRGPKPDARGPRPDARGPRPDSRGPKPEYRDRPRPDSRGPRPDYRGPKPEYRDRPKPDSRGPRPDSRGPKREDRDRRAPANRGGGQRDASRGRDWRPGGQHKDPRDRYKVPRDVKRKRMAHRFGWKKKKDEE